MNSELLPKPFLRWAGGKRWLTSSIHDVIPHRYGKYFEPFLGGASIFFALRPDNASLSDLNTALIETYMAVRDAPQVVYNIVDQWPNTKKQFYEIRGRQFEEPCWRAARFIYLNKTCWNGLYRVNKRGQFNVPYGKTHDRQVLDKERLLAASKALKGTKLISRDFEEALDDAKKGDLIYLDPPYTGVHSNNGFIRYNERLFSWDDQIRLAKVASRLAKSGCHVLVSNARHADIVSLYEDFERIEITRASQIAGQVRHRRKAKEVLFYSPSLADEAPI